MPSKKPARAAAAAAFKTPEKTPETTPEKTAGKMPAKTPEPMSAPFGRTATLIVAACVMAGGILFAARQQAQPLLTTTPRQEVVPAPDVQASRVMASTAAPSMSASPSAKAPVTIVGCLEVDNETFRLKDTSGADAPKSRSWKSGFFKRSSSPVVLNDAAGAHLADHVGQRVSVTGPLVDRQMRVTSLRRVAASCQ